METTNTDVAVIRINPATDPTVIVFAQQAERLLGFAQAAVVTDDSGVKLATDDLSILATLKKNVESVRKEYVEPINDHLKAVNGQFKTISDPLEAAEKNLKEKVLAYKLEQRVKAEQAEEINRLRMEAARKEMELKGELTESVSLVEPVSVLPKTVTSDIGSSSVRLTWHAKVTDFALLPNQYKLPNTSMLDFMARQITKTGKPIIPGVEFYQEESLSVRARG